jgi:hypothetical protein
MFFSSNWTGTVIFLAGISLSGIGLSVADGTGAREEDEKTQRREDITASSVRIYPTYKVMSGNNSALIFSIMEGTRPPLLALRTSKDHRETLEASKKAHPSTQPPQVHRNPPQYLQEGTLRN